MKIYDDGISLTRNGYIFTDYFRGLNYMLRVTNKHMLHHHFYIDIF